MQGQLALIGPPTVTPPDLDSKTIAALCELERPVDLEALRHLGASALFRPGVDGAVAGLLCASERWQRILLAALEACAVQSDFDLRRVSEGVFSEALALPDKNPEQA